MPTARFTSSITVPRRAHSPWSGGSTSKPLSLPESAALSPRKPLAGPVGKESGLETGLGLAAVLGALVLGLSGVAGRDADCFALAPCCAARLARSTVPRKAKRLV